MNPVTSFLCSKPSRLPDLLRQKGKVFIGAKGPHTICAHPTSLTSIPLFLFFPSLHSTQTDLPAFPGTCQGQPHMRAFELAIHSVGSPCLLPHLLSKFFPGHPIQNQNCYATCPVLPTPVPCLSLLLSTYHHHQILLFILLSVSP